MSRISNTIMMLKILSSGKKTTVNELAYMIEVTPRMIRKYKDDLEKAGIYIESSVGANGGYIYKNEEKIDFNFSIVDLEILEDLKYQLEQYRYFSKKRLLDLESIIEKMRSVVIMKKYTIRNENDKHKSNIDLFEHAINQSKNLKVMLNRKKVVTIKPLQLNFYNDMVFVTGYVIEYQSIRTYSLYEIKKIL